MPETSAQRALAVSLSARSDADLARLFAERSISPSSTWRDMFDAAEALLDPASVARGLPALNRDEAAALLDAEHPAPAGVREQLASHALVGEDGLPFPSVFETAREILPSGIPDAVAPRRATSTPESTGAASEAVFTNAASVADILMQTLDAPLGRIGSGSLGATERRRLVDAGAVTTATEADLLVGSPPTWACSARTTARGSCLRPGANGCGCRPSSAGSAPPRLCATPFRGPTARPTAAGSPPSSGPRRRPSTPRDPTARPSGSNDSCGGGLLDAAGHATPWARPLAEGGDVDTSALRELLPPEVDRVYLQNDLTAIAPGPLAPHLDVRLRSMAARESRAQASSYRFSAATIGAAITAGETADSLREFLTGSRSPVSPSLWRTSSSAPPPNTDACA